MSIRSVGKLRQWGGHVTGDYPHFRAAVVESQLETSLVRNVHCVIALTQTNNLRTSFYRNSTRYSTYIESKGLSLETTFWEALLLGATDLRDIARTRGRHDFF